MRTVYEPHVNVFVLHGYNILTSLVLRYEVHMNFIRSACKFMWINLILFHMKFMINSLELHMNFKWTSNEFHMNKFDFISYESTYEVHNEFLRRSHKFHVKLCIYGFTRTSYEWASRSIVPLNVTMRISSSTIFVFWVKILICMPSVITQWLLCGLWLLIRTTTQMEG